MTNEQLIQFYNDNIEGKTVDEISAQIYKQVGGSGSAMANSGIAKHLNDSVYGRDVKDDLTKLSLLLNAEREKMKTAEETAGEWMDENADDLIDGWLDDHPEATTTVQDGSITGTKLTAGFLETIKNGYVTPELFGAVGDGETDDTDAFRSAFSLLEESDTVWLSENKHYKITDVVRIEKPVHLIGAPNTYIECKGDGCFQITDPLYDHYRDYTEGDYFVSWREKIEDGGQTTYIYHPSGTTQNKVYVVENRRYKDTGESYTDIKGSAYTGNRSVFENVVFAWCDKVFTGDIKYLSFVNCKFHHNVAVFYCEGVSQQKLSKWFGKIDITNCDIRYNTELFYLSDTNFDVENYRLSLNAVNINGGVITDTSFFYQTEEHNYNKLFRVESILLNGVDIEKSDFYLAQYHDGNGDLVRQKWIGGLYIYNVVFQSCHIEQFRFLWHGYSGQSRGLIRSQVTFDTCYIQQNALRIIDCDDNETDMYGGSYTETTFLVSFINCPMTINANLTDENDSGENTIGENKYLVHQPVLPLVRMNHYQYSVVLDNYTRNALVNYFEGQLPATKNGVSTPKKLSADTMAVIVDGKNSLHTSAAMSDIAQYTVSSLLANGDTVARLDNLSGFASDLGLTSDGLDNKNASDISRILNTKTAGQLEDVMDRFIDTLNASGNVKPSGLYIAEDTANQFVSANNISFEFHNSPVGQKVYYNDVAVHTIREANRVFTSYRFAKTNSEFLKKLPNGTFVTMDVAGYPTELYAVVNTGQGVKVLDIANSTNNLYYLVLSSNDSNNFAGREEFQNNNALQYVRIEFTPTAALPDDLFNGCTNLTDIYVPWASTDATLNATAPWTDKTGVNVHYSDS